MTIYDRVVLYGFAILFIFFSVFIYPQVEVTVNLRENEHATGIFTAKFGKKAVVNIMVMDKTLERERISNGDGIRDGRTSKMRRMICGCCKWWSGLLALGQCMLPGPDESCKDTWNTDGCNNWASPLRPPKE
ncbi:MAG: hypothetical protein ABIG63_17480 [Chloroflexota bacterium]